MGHIDIRPMAKKGRTLLIILAVSALMGSVLPGMGFCADDVLKEKWGVKIEGIRLSAAGYMIDFRYRILDPDKAMPLLNSKYKPYLLDEETGAKFMVPSSPKVGPMRQTVRVGKPATGKTYFVIFANPGRYLKQGSRVSVVIGDFKAENLVIN